MKPFKTILVIIGLLVLLLGGFALKTYWDAGEFREIIPHYSSECWAVPGVLSSEDITIHPKTGMAFISSDDRRQVFHGGTGRQGAIYGYDLSSTDPVPVNLTADFPKEFHPHGIGLFIGKDLNTSLFVVNHVKGQHFIEIFDYLDNKLVHRESIKGPLMTSPNDVLPVGERSFYVTNDHGKPTGIMRTLEEYLQMAWSYVLYFDGETFKKVAEGLAYANGVNMSGDGKTVFVAATVSWGVFVYDRDEESGELKFRSFIDAETGVDNIEMDDEGNLWIGAHPRILTFVKYSKNPAVKSPSQVIKITPAEKGNFKVDEIYLNDGSPMSGSSAAAVYGERLLIGSVFDGKFLVCRMDK